MKYSDVSNRYLLFTVAIVICALFTAGLWPFQFITTNHAVYSGKTSCLLCDRFTSAYMPVGFGQNCSGRGLPVTIEGRLSFKPGSRYPYFARALTFFDTHTGTEAIAIGQFERNLVVRVRKKSNETGLPIVAEQGTDSFFTGRSQSTITVCIDRAMTTVSAGDRVMEFKNPLLPEAAILVIGNSPWGDSPWSGEICLGPVADSFIRPALVVPRYFHPVALTVLKPLWQDFAISRWYVRDIALNFAGFVPFGYLLVLLLYRKFRLSPLKAAAIGIGTGFSISMIIELLQVFLPYRSSQMSDVVCNTLGTAAGVLLFLVWKALRYRFTSGRT